MFKTMNRSNTKNVNILGNISKYSSPPRLNYFCQQKSERQLQHATSRATSIVFIATFWIHPPSPIHLSHTEAGSETVEKSGFSEQ